MDIFPSNLISLPISSPLRQGGHTPNHSATEVIHQLKQLRYSTEVQVWDDQPRLYSVVLHTQKSK